MTMGRCSTPAGTTGDYITVDYIDLTTTDSENVTSSLVRLDFEVLITHQSQIKGLSNEYFGNHTWLESGGPMFKMEINIGYTKYYR